MITWARLARSRPRETRSDATRIKSLPALNECMVLRRDEVDVVDVSVPTVVKYDGSTRARSLPRRTAVSLDLVNTRIPRAISVSRGRISDLVLSGCGDPSEVLSELSEPGSELENISSCGDLEVGEAGVSMRSLRMRSIRYSGLRLCEKIRQSVIAHKI